MIALKLILIFRRYIFIQIEATSNNYNNTIYSDNNKTMFHLCIYGLVTRYTIQMYYIKMKN